MIYLPFYVNNRLGNLSSQHLSVIFYVNSHLYLWIVILFHWPFLPASHTLDVLLFCSLSSHRLSTPGLRMWDSTIGIVWLFRRLKKHILKRVVILHTWNIYFFYKKRKYILWSQMANLQMNFCKFAYTVGTQLYVPFKALWTDLDLIFFFLIEV